MVSLCFNEGKRAYSSVSKKIGAMKSQEIFMHIQVWLGAMKSWMIGMHDQLWGSPSHETLSPMKHYKQFGKQLTFLIYREI
jgi:hypothetical protein